jgi:replicative DNA helicase
MINDQSLPPQNIEAEESILGGILLDPKALGRISDFLIPDAFYVKTHQDIYRATLALQGKGKPTDLMTVSSWLQDNYLLEDIGGMPRLLQLIERTVSAANIDRYAELVMDKYMRRQLISTGGEIIELARDTTLELENVFDESEQKIFRLTQKRPQEGLIFLGDTLIETFNEIEKMQETTTLPGIETQFYDLDAMTSGLQPSDLIIIAGRPSMGKTSFALNIAYNIAQQNLPVAVFSLEMSKEQLAQRLLSNEAKIESNRIRSGRLGQNDLEKVLSGMEKLLNLPIYIDDSANLSVIQMRSQVRRLQAEKKGQMGLVLIDYLQLMEGGGDNRVQELSKITRSLKGLAREIHAPVIALSQLSRAVESRNNKRPMMSDLRESGCLAGDSLVELGNTRAKVPICELVNCSNFTVFALNEETMKLEKALVTKVFSTGFKPIFRLTTRLGRTIRATANHKFLTVHSWQRLDELNIGNYIALPSSQFDKTQSLQEIITCLQNHQANPNKDIIPNDIWRLYAIPAMEQSGLTTRQMQVALGNQYCGTSLYKSNLSRARANKLGDILECSQIQHLADSDIYWDEVMAIQADGETEVYDLTVDKFHNFIANNIIVHNSIEQDADLIMMLYRDEYYNPDSPDRGVAEVIITKHRNGPTGIIKLLFQPEFTKFLNLKQSRPSY